MNVMTRDQFLLSLGVAVTGDHKKDFLTGLREYEGTSTYYNLFSIFFLGGTTWEDFEYSAKYPMKQEGKWWFASFHKQFRQVDMFELPLVAGESINGHLDSIMWDTIARDHYCRLRFYMEQFFEHQY